MRRLLSCDTETTTINNGDPFNPGNMLVSVGFYDGENYTLFYKKFDLQQIQNLVDTSILVFVNGKFDLHWLRILGIDLTNISIRDCQLAEFIISDQTHAYASLNEIALKYTGQQKIDVVKLDYWDKGIDTWFIPKDLLEMYLMEDLRLTYEVFSQQKEILQQTGKYPLFVLQSLDQLVLAEMEWTGILYNKEESIKRGDDLQEKITELTEYIKSYSLCPSFNCASGDHLSCLLYGGTIIHTNRVPVGFYKTGAKVGQQRYKLYEETFIQERLVEPLKGSELKKEGYFSTDEDTLLSLKPKKKEVKKLIDTILELSKTEKLQGTYFYGIPKLMDEKGWEGNYIHGQLNQCVARTGRLSASKPNQQNFLPEVKQLCVSRYD